MIWKLGIIVGYALLMAYANGGGDGLIALAGGLLALGALRVVGVFGDRIGAGLREFAEQRDRHDRLVR